MYVGMIHRSNSMPDKAGVALEDNRRHLSGRRLAPVVDMKFRLPFNPIWKKGNSLPLLQEFVASGTSDKITLRN